MKEVVFYKMTSGKSSIKDFLNSLFGKEAQKITWVLNLIEDLEIVSTKKKRLLIKKGQS